MNTENDFARLETMRPYVIACAAVVLAGCATTHADVNHAADPALSADAYATYALVGRSVGEASVDDAIQSAIHGAMTRSGYQHSEIDQADLLVTFKVLTVGGDLRPQALAASGLGAGTAPGVGDVLSGPEMMLTPEATAEAVDKLVLIQLQDAKSMRVVWVGWSQAEVDRALVDVKATEAAFKILRRVPVRGAG